MGRLESQRLVVDAGCGVYWRPVFAVPPVCRSTNRPLFSGWRHWRPVRPTKIGRIASKTIGFYLVSTAIAISIGLGLSNLIAPGLGLTSATQETLRASHSEVVGAKMTQAVAPDVWTTLLNIIPTNPFSALANGNMLQVLFFSVALGVGVATLPSKERTLLVGVFDGLTQVIIHIIQGLMKLAPLAVFCLLLSTGAKLGWDVITVLGQYVLTVLFGLGVLAFGLYPLLVKTLTKHSLSTFSGRLRQHSCSPSLHLHLPQQCL